MIKTKVAFLEGRLLSSQSEQSEKFSKALIGWKKAGHKRNMQKVAAFTTQKHKQPFTAVFEK